MKSFRRTIAVCVVLVAAAAGGCGTTRWSDTSRTATEQMLMSDAIDRSVSQIDFSSLAGRDVFLDGRYITGLVDEKYVMSTLRQHLFASGCIVKEKAEEVQYIVEVRAGALGTNRNDVLFGVPATSLPTGGMIPMVPTSIPELSFMKRTAQQGVCKIAVFAYDRTSGHPLWQSGVHQQVSKARDTWVLGTGPFQHGTIYDGTKFAGERLKVPLAKGANGPARDKVWVAHQMRFREPPAVADTVPRRLPPSTTPPPADATASSDSPSPPPSVTTTSAYGGGVQSSSAGSSSSSSASSSGGSASSSSGSSAASSPAQSSPTPNAATDAYGAVQAVDWARAVRQGVAH